VWAWGEEDVVEEWVQVRVVEFIIADVLRFK
jgi:hypothetical protein